MSDYSYSDTQSGPRLVSYERHDGSLDFDNRLPSRHDVYAPPFSDRRTQRSYSFQKREEVSVNQILRRTSNSVAPITVEAMSRTHPIERRHDYERPRETNDIAYRGMSNDLLRYHRDDDYPGQSVSYNGTRYYDPVQETDILGDDISEGHSDVYGPGTYHPADDESSSSGEEDDPELRELEERDNIVSKYEKGPESKDIDPWENPEFDVYAKMDRFGFVHKNADEATEEERANRRRVEKEIRRVNKWLAMEAAWKKGRIPKKLEERTWKGIPEKLRMTIWPRLLGAVEMKEARPDVYYQLLMRARLVSKDIKQIDLDINRTYRDHISFRRRYDVKQQSLLNVLAAYSMYNTEVGYCQGMSQIAALFLMYLDEEDTFWCIHALMVGRKHTMHGFFVPGFPKLTRFEAHFKKVLKKYRPRVYKHLEKNDIPYIYLTKWWFGCFLDRVPFSLALRLWDVYILEGDPILLAMALNIMKMHEKTIRKLQMENFMDFIQTTLANNFGYSDDETMFSLREVLSKLKSDNLHFPPPPKPDDLPEVPTKALGPILSRPISSIREEQEEIKSRRSHAASVGRSPYPRRSRKPIAHSRAPSAPGTRMPDDSRVSSSSLHETRQPIPNGKEIPFEIPTRRVPSFKKQHVPPPDPRQSTPTNGQGYSPRVVAHKDGFEPRIPALSVRSSSIRDEHTGKMVTVVRGDDDDFDDSTLTRRNMNDKWREQRRQPPERVRQTSNNVTIITLGDDSVI